MCHEITRSSSLIYYCLDYEKELYVGGKSFAKPILGNFLVTSIMGEKVYPRKLSNKVTKQYELIPAATANPIASQNLTFHVPSTAGDMGKNKRIKAGMHVAPIIKHVYEDADKHYEFLPTSMYQQHSYVFVVFRISDVVFYDGLDASVRLFYIPGGKTLKKIAESLEKLFGAMEKYEERAFDKIISDTEWAYKKMERAIAREDETSTQ